MNAVKYRVEHSMSAVFFIQNVLCICVHSISDSLEVKNSLKKSTHQLGISSFKNLSFP